MVEVHNGRAAATPHLGGLQGSNARTGAEVEGSGRCGFQTDRDISSAAADHDIATGEVECACGFVTDGHVTGACPSAAAHIGHACACSMFADQAIHIRNAAAGEVQSSIAVVANTQVKGIRPSAAVDIHRAGASVAVADESTPVRQTSAVDSESCIITASKPCIEVGSGVGNLPCGREGERSAGDGRAARVGVVA